MKSSEMKKNEIYRHKVLKIKVKYLGSKNQGKEHWFMPAGGGMAFKSSLFDIEPRGKA